MLDVFEKQIASELDRIIVEDQQTSGMRDEKWTRRIKERLCDMGHQKGFGVSAEKCNGADTGKWLFDLVWAEHRKNPERLISVPLVMALEWDTRLDNILWSFEKLLVPKAPQKVIVFQQATTEKVRNLITILEDRIRYFQSRVQVERYLLAGYAYEKRVYVYESA